ncbi:PC-esterase domain-containing protein 1A-like isoform X2 [Tachypleus tridentatus]
MRAQYKDLVLLAQDNKLISETQVKRKMENSFLGDQMVRHGEKNNGRDFIEERVFNKKHSNFSFFFLTRVYDCYVETLVEKFKEEQPDIIVVNSCLWDISRWGPNGVEEYRKNLNMLMAKLQDTVSEDCLVIWSTTLPLSQKMKGGFLVPQLEFLKYSLRFHVMEANHYARQIVVKHGFDVLDMHYNLRMQIDQRAADGIHWLPPALRYMTNLLLTHISLALGAPLPHRSSSALNNSEMEIMASSDQAPTEDKVISQLEETCPSERDILFNKNQPVVSQEETFSRKIHDYDKLQLDQNVYHSYSSTSQPQQKRKAPLLLYPLTPYDLFQKAKSHITNQASTSLRSNYSDVVENMNQVVVTSHYSNNERSKLPWNYATQKDSISKQTAKYSNAYMTSYPVRSSVYNGEHLQLRKIGFTQLTYHALGSHFSNCTTQQQYCGPVQAASSMYNTT